MQMQPDSLLIQSVLRSLTKIRGGTRVAGALLRFWQQRMLRRSVIARIDDGYLMHVDAQSFIERDLMLFGAFERELHDFIGSTLRKGAVFLDVGANVGCYSLQAASLVGPTGRVVSFEPSPLVFERLRQNVDLNGFTNTSLCSCALGGASARRLLYLEAGNEGYSNAIASLHPSVWHGRRDTSREIEVRTMDEWFQESGLSRLDLVKIDVEGAEFEVLEGARQTLATHQPTIAMEVCDHTYAAAGRQPAMLSGFFDALGYRTERLDKNGDLVDWAGSGDFGTFTLIASPRWRPAGGTWEQSGPSSGKLADV